MERRSCANRPHGAQRDPGRDSDASVPAHRSAWSNLLDKLETGGSFGIVLQPRVDHDQVLSTSLDFQVYDPALEMATPTTAWIALAAALNAFNRSMGLADP